jgi:hypothetical protein
VPIFNGSDWVNFIFCAGEGEVYLELLLDGNSGHTNYHQANRNFDIFCFRRDDTGDIALGTGPSWVAGAVAGSDTARGTGAGSTELVRFDGLVVNKNEIVLRYGSGANDLTTVPPYCATCVGSFRAFDGDYSFTINRRLIWNRYNQKPEAVRVYIASNWTYSTASWRQASGAGNEPYFQILNGMVAYEAVKNLVVHAYAVCRNSTSTAKIVGTGIGIDDASTTYALNANNGTVINAIREAFTAEYIGTANGIGLHTIYWLEIGAGADTQTWYGSGDNALSGLLGTFWC